MNSICKFCGGEITWGKENGKPVPHNPDGSVHRCKKEAASPQENQPLIGMVKTYNSGSATFLMMDGSSKTYAIILSLKNEWDGLGFSNSPGEQVWLKFSIDKNKFVQHYERINTPAGAPEQLPQGITDIAGDAVEEAQRKAAGFGVLAHQTSEVPETKPPAEESRMPTREELLAMVYDYNTYWKAKTLMDVQAYDEIRLQVAWKNWQECVNSAIHYQTDLQGLATEQGVFGFAVKIHGFLQIKTGRA